MKPEYRLIVEAGPDMGKQFPVPERGLDIGRSSQNDVVLSDGELSRKHCRVDFRGDELWVTDLASANGTLVNGKEVPESRLVDGDALMLGISVLRVRSGGVAAGTGSASAPAPAPSAPAAAGSVDLGLHSAQSKSGDSASQEKKAKKTLLWSVVSFLLLVVAALVIKMLLEAPVDTGKVPARRVEEPKGLEVRYTKLEGSVENIFRYDLLLQTNGAVAVEIDDLEQSRHVRKESKEPVAESLRKDLARLISQAGFFGLDDIYEGVSPPNKVAEYELTVVLGNDVKRVRVSNRSEPEEFRDVREHLETFVRNELGLWAIEFSSEKLQQMAADKFKLGQRLLQERDIAVENLCESIRSFRECENLVETVEPKPEFYEEAVENRREAERFLDERYKERNFNADRAIKMKDWAVAAEELRGLIALIPDRSDERNQDAERRLLDVENRLKKGKK